MNHCGRLLRFGSVEDHERRDAHPGSDGRSVGQENKKVQAKPRFKESAGGSVSSGSSAHKRSHAQLDAESLSNQLVGSDEERRTRSRSSATDSGNGHAATAGPAATEYAVSAAQRPTAEWTAWNAADEAEISSSTARVDLRISYTVPRDQVLQHNTWPTGCVSPPLGAGVRWSSGGSFSSPENFRHGGWYGTDSSESQPWWQQEGWQDWQSDRRW